MNGKFNFKFREFKHREAGKFQKDGLEIQFKEAYILKCDDLTKDGEIYELECNVPADDTNLVNKLKKYKYMDDVVLELKIQIMKDKKTGIIKLIDVITTDENATDKNKTAVQENLY